MTRRQLNAKEAAEALGISVDALRMRCRRGTLECEHDENGRLHVWLDTDETSDESSELVEELREQVHYLREQLRREQEAHAEARRIIAALTSRIPQLEAPSEPQNQAESAGDRSDRGTTVPGEAAEPERRSIWRRWFGD